MCLVVSSFLESPKFVAEIFKKNKSDYLFITAPENIAWLLNIRGYDNPTSPIPNCYLVINKKRNIYLIVERDKSKKLIKEKRLKKYQIIDPKNISSLFQNLNKFLYN